MPTRNINSDLNLTSDLTVAGEVEFSGLNPTSVSPIVVSDGGNLGTRSLANILSDIAALPLAGGNMTGHILLNNGIELRSKDTSSNIKTIARVNSNNELEYGWSAGGPVKFMGGGSYTERMRIHTNGNVGIGATNPTAKITLADHTTAAGGIKFRTASSSVSLWSSGSGNLNTDKSFNVGSRLRVVGGNAAADPDIGFSGASSGTGFSRASNDITFITSAAERMRINSSGNVGIGGTPVGAKLEIHKAQVTTQFDRDCFLRLHPTATTNSGGFTNIMFGTSPVNNFGVAIGGKRAGTDGTPSFSIRMLNDAITGTEVLNITNSGQVSTTNTIFARKDNVSSYLDAQVRLDSFGGSSSLAGLGFHISGTIGRMLFMNSSGNLFWNSTSSKIWHAGNDGSGSGLDADKLDGLQLNSDDRNDSANVVCRTQANGYAYFGWLNTTSGNNGTTAISRIYASHDGFVRYYTPANFGAQIGSHISYNDLTNKPTIPSLSGYATEAHVSSEISNLIGGAPGALDTLNELAAAIGDDASYASSITTALAAKAPLASPALTGSPTAPTQGFAENSTKIATTAYVKSQGYAQAGDENIIDGAAAIWNADGDGDVFHYNDSNPVHNGKSTGAVLNIRGDGTNDHSLVRAGIFTSDHVSTANGYYVGTLLGTSNSTTTQVINSSGAWTGSVIPAAKLSTATTQSSSENSTKIATTAYVKNQGYITGSGIPTLSGSNSFTNSYNEFGNSTGSVSNDGSWNARLNLAGSSHAKLDVKSVSDGIITTMYSHSGQNAGRIGTSSNHKLYLMIAGSAKATLNTNGTFFVGSSRVFDDAYHPNADRLTTGRTITLGGDLSGSSEFTGAANITITAAVANDSHTHDGRYFTETEVTNHYKTLAVQGNFMNTYSWSGDTVGSADSGWGHFGSVPFSGNSGYGQNGTDAENTRAIATLPNGAKGVVWRTPSNDAASGADGGWNCNINGVDSSKAYRSVIYFRKTDDSNNGQFYHGCAGGHTLNINGSANTNPYFHSPGISTFVQDRWYVSIGYIQAYQSSGAVTGGQSGVYDCTTGKLVSGGSDFMMKSGSTTQTHRTYLYYSSDPNTSVEFYAPRFEELNGNEPSKQELINKGLDGLDAMSFHSKYDPEALTQLTESSDANDDKFLLWDESASVWKYMRLDDLQDSIDNNTTYSVGDNGLTERNFTSAFKSKLEGIETGATADQTATEIRTLLSTVDGSGSGLDADKLDGVQGSSFLRSDATDTATGALTLSNTGNTFNGHHFFSAYDAAGNHYPHYLHGSSASAKVNIRVYNAGGGSFDTLYIAAGSNDMTWRGNKIWNAGNDGSGSGLDADKLDGLELHTGRNNGANKVVRTNSNGYLDTGFINTTSGDIGSGIPSRIYTNNAGSGDAYVRYADLASFRSLMNVTAKGAYQGREQNTSDQNYWVGTMGYGTTDFNTLFNYGSGHIDSWSNPANQPSSETSHWVGHQSMHYTNGTNHYGHQFVVGAGNPAYCYLRGRWGGSPTSWAKMWNSANDGSGSGLDADLLDGVHGSSFLRSDANDTASGAISFTGGQGAINITHSSILSSATSNWTGDPGGAGKIQYHSNRWYIVSDSSSNRIVQFRRNGTNASYIANSGNFVGNVEGNASTATSAATLTSSRTIALGGDVTGSASFNGGSNITISASLASGSVGASEIAANAVGSSEIANDAVGAAEIAASAVGASELNVSGNGSSSQFLRSDGDGTFTWATPTDTNTNTTYSAGGGLDLSGSNQFSLENDLRDGIQLIGLDSNDYIQWSNNSYFRGVVNGTERFRVNSSGSFGIGTAGPTHRLNVSGPNTSPNLQSSTVTSASLHLSNSDNAYGMYFACLSNGRGIIQQRRQTSTTKYDLLLQPYGGRVAIGRTSASTALHVNGTIANTIYNASQLPSASPAGQRAFAYSHYPLATSHGAVVSTNGSYVIPVYSDGSSWRAG